MLVSTRSLLMYPYLILFLFTATNAWRIYPCKWNPKESGKLDPVESDMFTKKRRPISEIAYISETFSDLKDFERKTLLVVGDEEGDEATFVQFDNYSPRRIPQCYIKLPSTRGYAIKETKENPYICLEFKGQRLFCASEKADMFPILNVIAGKIERVEAIQRKARDDEVKRRLLRKKEEEDERKRKLKEEEMRLAQCRNVALEIDAAQKKSRRFQDVAVLESLADSVPGLCASASEEEQQAASLALCKFSRALDRKLSQALYRHNLNPLMDLNTLAKRGEKVSVRVKRAVTDMCGGLPEEIQEKYNNRDCKQAESFQKEILDQVKKETSLESVHFLALEDIENAKKEVEDKLTVAKKTYEAEGKNRYKKCRKQCGRTCVKSPKSKKCKRDTKRCKNECIGKKNRKTVRCSESKVEPLEAQERKLEILEQVNVRKDEICQKETLGHKLGTGVQNLWNRVWE